jgi:hypothetical protein
MGINNKITTKLIFLLKTGTVNQITPDNKILRISIKKEVFQMVKDYQKE